MITLNFNPNPNSACSVTVIEFPDMVPGGPTGVDAPEAVAVSAGVVRCSNYTAHLGVHSLKPYILVLITHCVANRSADAFCLQTCQGQGKQA